ncbi:alginate O-acetyltransferase AlgX-related protein [Desulfovibrio inopinatus]|uniref:alginate O-acetyltransferase AlgX-related protein n=1 Tax=Desulfovibrio inopinatus TaxID=102109 RepID=UPI000486A308|nr:hypothetical protein [Desulfovibrio inopinatus]
MTSHRSNIVRKGIALLSSIIFIAFLCTPIVGSVFKLAPSVPIMESSPPPLPEFRCDVAWLSSVFTKLRRGWLEKNFAFREVLVRWQNMFNILALDSSTQYDSVMAGKNNWLFLSQENHELNVVTDYRTVTPYTQHDLDFWVKEFTRRRDMLAAKGIHYLVVMPPNKHTVYADQLPDELNRVHDFSKADQLITALRNVGIEVVDLRDALAKATKDHLTYYRTDNHWTTYGAHAGYTVIINALAKWFPNLKPTTLDDYNIDVRPGLLGGLGYMLAMGDHYTEDKITFTPKAGRKAREVPVDYTHPRFFQPPIAMETGDPTLPKAVVIRDSFSHELVPLLSEKFNRIIYLWPYPTDSQYVRHFGEEVIDAEKPDVVIDEFVERYFTRPPPKHSRQ